MSKKKAPEEKIPEEEAPAKEVTEEEAQAEVIPQESEKEEPVVEAPEEVVEDVDEEPEEETPKRKKTKKSRAKLTVLQAAVFETIRERPQRPRAIQTIIRGTGGVDIPRNEIIRSLNELRGKGLVDKVSAKAWQAT